MSTSRSSEIEQALSNPTPANLPFRVIEIEEIKFDPGWESHLLKLFHDIGRSSGDELVVYHGEIFTDTYSIKLVEKAIHPSIFKNLPLQIHQEKVIFSSNNLDPISEKIDPDNIILKVSETFLNNEEYIVMFPLMKTSIRSLLVRKYTKGFSCEDTVIYIFGFVLRALNSLHQQGIYHSEISAGHIFIDSAGQLKLGYGSTVYDDVENFELDSNLVPKDEDKEKGDIYLLGVAALEMLYGPDYFIGNRKRGIETLVSNIKKQKSKMACFSRKKSISEKFIKLVVTCLDEDPDFRPKASILMRKKVFRGIDISRVPMQLRLET